jgi:hypothetical protein
MRNEWKELLPRPAEGAGGFWGGEWPDTQQNLAKPRREGSTPKICGPAVFFERGGLTRRAESSTTRNKLQRSIGVNAVQGLIVKRAARLFASMLKRNLLVKLFRLTSDRICLW